MFPRAGMPAIHHARPTRLALWQIVHHAWDDFIAGYEKHHRRTMEPLRGEAVAAVRAFYRCGDLAAGFTRFHCPECGHEKILAFMCSCCNMKPAAATVVTMTVFLVDRILYFWPQFVSYKPWFMTTHMPHSGAVGEDGGRLPLSPRSERHIFPRQLHHLPAPRSEIVKRLRHPRFPNCKIPLRSHYPITFISRWLQSPQTLVACGCARRASASLTTPERQESFTMASFFRSKACR